MYLIAGLGNPGKEYVHTRHNIGFKVINLWCRKLNIRLRGRRFESFHAETVFRGKRIVLLRPMTFMNLSGMSIKACIRFHDIKPENLLVIHDDIDLPLGRLKMVRKGGAGGHKGALSTIQNLGTTEFPRLKIGIGRPLKGETIEEYVLSPFYIDEKPIIKKVIQEGVRACELFISNGVESAMNRINCQNLADKEVRN